MKGGAQGRPATHQSEGTMLQKQANLRSHAAASLTWAHSCRVLRASPLAKMQCSPQAKRTQQLPGGDTTGVQPALLLLQACPQLAVWQCLYW